MCAQLLHVNLIMYSLMTPECLISWLLRTDMYNGLWRSFRMMTYAIGYLRVGRKQDVSGCCAFWRKADTGCL